MTLPLTNVTKSSSATNLPVEHVDHHKTGEVLNATADSHGGALQQTWKTILGYGHQATNTGHSSARDWTEVFSSPAKDHGIVEKTDNSFATGTASAGTTTSSSITSGATSAKATAP
ncbi:hypothetical protein CHS0354_013949 [Potamilus streckersoni]|uniref:Uncharacterized protein n=1 Tax=Potamilus streckersoni TaxID=2493646 RepID=A0AAE0VLC0_9BIVA|nr:hypothetical protein CHS0354_013949 [Potamilus streckersoni]